MRCRPSALEAFHEPGQLLFDVSRALAVGCGGGENAEKRWPFPEDVVVCSVVDSWTQGDGIRSTPPGPDIAVIAL
jgi:hypothetical protein